MSLTRLSVDEASAHMLAGVKALGEESADLRDALGRVLARDVASPVSLPLWDNARMTSRSGGERSATSESSGAVLSRRAPSTAMPRERSASVSAATNAAG